MARIVSACRHICQFDSESADMHRYGTYPRVIILGEWRLRDLHINQQVELANAVNAVFFLHEDLGNNVFDPQELVVLENPVYAESEGNILKVFDHRIQDRRYANLRWETEKRRYQEGKHNFNRKPVHPAFDSWDYNVKFRLPPFSLDNFVSNFATPALPDRLKKKHKSVELYVGCGLSPVQFILPSLKADLQERSETHMGGVIADCAELTRGNVVAVVGGFNIRKESKIHHVLKNRGISYIVVNQAAEVWAQYKDVKPFYEI